MLSGPPDPAAWAAMREIAGLEHAALHAAYWEHRHEYDRGTLTGQAYWAAVGGHAGTMFTSTQVDSLLAADVDLWTQLNMPMVEWAARLQAAGVRTGILSNIGDAIAEGICGRLSWLSEFAHCTWSHALFLAKPEAAIYLKAAASLEVQPEQILFVDDREENIRAAEGVGMQAIHYTTQGAFEGEMRGRDFGYLLDAGEGTP